MNRATYALGGTGLALGGLFLLATECGPSTSKEASQRVSSAEQSGGSDGIGSLSDDEGRGFGARRGERFDREDVLMRNKHPSRDGVYIQPTFTKAKIGTMALDAAFSAPDGGAIFNGPLMWAQPLYLSKGPNGTGAFFVVTTGNNVYALDETTGATIWGVNLGTPQQINPATCVDSITRGMIATPVIDPDPGPDGFPTMYVSAYVGPPAPGTVLPPGTVVSPVIENLLFALSTKDGSVRAGWPVHASAIQAAFAANAGVTNYTAEAQNQRGALTLDKGVLYVGYGSHGDCGFYRGWVIAVDTADPTKTGVFMTGEQGGAIWAPGGMASDEKGVITVTGNGAPDAGVHVDSEQVTRLRGLAVLEHNSANTFYPSGVLPAGTLIRNPNGPPGVVEAGAPPLWKMLDQMDQDLGANNPVIVKVPGAAQASQDDQGDQNEQGDDTTTKYVAVAGKDGELFLLNAANFGGTDPGTLVPPGGAYIRTGLVNAKTISTPAAYTSASGTHIVLNVTHPAGCPGAPTTGPDGGPPPATLPVTMSILVTPGTPPSMSIAWCSPAGAPAPMVTTSDGTHDYVVWYVNNGVLTGVDADTGATLVTAAGTCPYNVRRWTSPIAVHGRLISTGDGHLCSWSLH
jgi:hypothetical protein